MREKINTNKKPEMNMTKSKQFEKRDLSDTCGIKRNKIMFSRRRRAREKETQTSTKTQK